MTVFVTNAQFHWVRRTTQQVEDGLVCRSVLIGGLSLFLLENGGDFDPALARMGVETKLVVIEG